MNVQIGSEGKWVRERESVREVRKAKVCRACCTGSWVVIEERVLGVLSSVR